MKNYSISPFFKEQYIKVTMTHFVTYGIVKIMERMGSSKGL